MKRLPYSPRCRWLVIALLTAVLGCSITSSAPAPRQVSPASRELQDQLLLKYAKLYISMKNFEEATRYVEALPADSPHAAEIPKLKEQIEQLIVEHDAAVAKRYEEAASVPIDLSVELRPQSDGYLIVEGRAQLPRYARLKVSIWREDQAKAWQMLNEQVAEIGPGSKFQTILTAHDQKSFDQTAFEQALTGNFELRVASCFRGLTDQPESVLKLIGPEGKKLTGDWVEQTNSEGKCVLYRQRYYFQTQVKSPQCISIKTQKL